MNGILSVALCTLSIWMTIFTASQEKSHNKGPKSLGMKSRKKREANTLDNTLLCSPDNFSFSLPSSFPLPLVVLGIKPAFLNMPSKYSTSPVFALFCFVLRGGLTELLRLTLNLLPAAHADLELVFFCLRLLGVWEYRPVPPGLASFVLADLERLCQVEHRAFSQHWL